MSSIHYRYYFSPVGRLLLLIRDLKLIYLGFEQEQLTTDITDFQFLNEETSDEIWAFFCKISALLDRYFEGERLDFRQLDFLEPQGSSFQQSVWRLLREIPYGKTVSYHDIAVQLGKPTATRAVGGAVGRNPISIFIPCHRVLSKTQALTGFGGGLVNKRFLLQLEQISYRDQGIEFVKPKKKHFKEVYG